MLVKAKMLLHHSSQPPPLGSTTLTWWMKEGRILLLMQWSTSRTQTDEDTKHYQELDLAKIEGEGKDATVKA